MSSFQTFKQSIDPPDSSAFTELDGEVGPFVTEYPNPIPPSILSSPLRKESFPNHDISKANHQMLMIDPSADLLHCGHIALFGRTREITKKLGLFLMSQETVAECKEKDPVFTEHERIEMVAAIKGIDFVVTRVPYMKEAHELLDEYNIEKLVHGDDLNPYMQEALRKNKLIAFPRTPGVSTTDIYHAVRHSVNTESGSSSTPDLAHIPIPAWIWPPTPFPAGQTVSALLCPGAFDIFNVGHLRFLRRASKLSHCQRLVVGLYTDELVTKIRKGRNGFESIKMTRSEPFLTFEQRRACLLGCVYVDDVVPINHIEFKLSWEQLDVSERLALVQQIQKDMADQSIKLACVVRGVKTLDINNNPAESRSQDDQSSTEEGCVTFCTIQDASIGEVTTESIISRILVRRKSSNKTQ